jgi:hypothetical protein
MNETPLMREIRLAAPAHVRLFRNNVGAFEWDLGKWLHYGLCKGSSDLIGWTQQDGKAIFTAVETKGKRGRLTQDQENFLYQVEAAGGIAIVARSVDEALDGLRRG